MPAILAFVFAGIMGYLLIDNSGVNDYEVPEVLTTAMTSIIAYFFGMGASTRSGRPPVFTIEQVAALLNKDID